MQDQLLFGSSFPFRPMGQGAHDFQALSPSPGSLNAALWQNASRTLAVERLAASMHSLIGQPNELPMQLPSHGVGH